MWKDWGLSQLKGDEQALNTVCGPGVGPAPEFVFFLFFSLFWFGGLFVLNDTVAVLEHLMKFEEKAPVLRTHTVKY